MPDIHHLNSGFDTNFDSDTALRGREEEEATTTRGRSDDARRLVSFPLSFVSFLLRSVSVPFRPLFGPVSLPFRRPRFTFSLQSN